MVKIRKLEKQFVKKDIIFDEHDIEFFKSMGLSVNLDKGRYIHRICDEDGDLMEERQYNISVD